MSAATWPTSCLSNPRTDDTGRAAGTSNVDAVGRLDAHRVREADLRARARRALRLRAVADADDLELRRRSPRDTPVDHVRDQRCACRPCSARFSRVVVGPRRRCSSSPSRLTVIASGDSCSSVALRALHGDVLTVDGRPRRRSGSVIGCFPMRDMTRSATRPGRGPRRRRWRSRLAVGHAGPGWWTGSRCPCRRAPRGTPSACE